MHIFLSSRNIFKYVPNMLKTVKRNEKYIFNLKTYLIFNLQIPKYIWKYISGSRKHISSLTA